jgi:hypothetical protein
VRELRSALGELTREAEAEPPAAPPPVEVPPPSAPAPTPEEAPPGIGPGPTPSPEGASPVEVHPERPSVAAPEAPSADAATLGALMKKARGLAVRVRTLPSDSEAAVEAATHIHEATELLRARRFAEADAALTRLMRVLAASESQS